MPNPDRLLHTLHKAVLAFRASPGRKGRLVALTDAADILVAGDLHGHVENFRRLLNRAALQDNPRRHLVLQEVVHGGFYYPGGGDKSHQLLDLIAALKCQFPTQVHFLLGNHELAQWKNHMIAKGDLNLNDLFRAGVQEAYGARAEEIDAAYGELFAAADLALRAPNRIFISHSLPSARNLESFDPADLEREEVHDRDLVWGGFVHSLVWGRDLSPDNVRAFLKKVDADLLISGHIPCNLGFEVPSPYQLILDCKGTPACFCLFPAEKTLTMEELTDYVETL